MDVPLLGEDWRRFCDLCAEAKAAGYWLQDTRRDVAERFELRRARRVVCTASDLDALADWLRG